MTRTSHSGSTSRSRPRWRAPVVAGAAALALVAGAAACGDGDSGDAEAAGERLTVVLEWSPNTNHAGVYVAEAAGWYDEAGLDVEIIEPGDAGSLQLLGAGRADVAFTTQEELVPARLAGADVVAVAAVVEHNTSSLLTLESDGVSRPRDLEGKRYGGFGGPLEEALVRDLVECDGGDPDAVSFAEVGEADYRVGLTADRYDAVWIFDGWDGIRLTEIDGLATRSIPFLDHTDCIPDWYTPMLAAGRDALDSEALGSFMAATARGYREAMADPEAAASALLAAAPELDADLVGASAVYLSTRYSEDPERWGLIDPGRFEAFASYLLEAGLIEEPIVAEEAYTNDLLADP